ADTAVYYCAR
nr:immunoglobulin heavy chain junction region [Homo sapiens]MBN4515790.1 immunoglobulin heavy chain junction region [Homo sapiens]